MTRSAHLHAVCDYRCVRRLHADDQEQILAWMTARALEHDTPPVLCEMACEHRKPHQIRRPGVTVVARLVVPARMQAQHESFHRLQPLLTPERLA